MWRKHQFLTYLIVHNSKRMPTLAEIDQTRSQLTSRYNALETYRTTQLANNVNQINQLFVEYIKTAGTDDSKLVGDNSILDKIQQIDTKYAAFKTLVTDTSQLLNTLSSQADIGQRLQTLGDKQTSITNLKKDVKELEQRVDTGEEREELIKTRDEKSSYGELYGGINRPLHLNSLPIMLSLTVIFLMGGLYALSTFFPNIVGSITGTIQSVKLQQSDEPFSIKGLLLSPYLLITVIIGLVSGFAIYAAKKDGKI
jgi:hypothetical protein